MLADELDYVVGVDTHLDEHELAIVAARSGAVVARRAVLASARGCAAALRFAREAANGARVWAIEGTGSYGAGLARYLAGGGETVLEILNPLLDAVADGAAVKVTAPERVSPALVFWVILKSIGPAMPLKRVVLAVHCLPSIECWSFTAYPGRIVILSALIGDVSGGRINV